MSPRSLPVFLNLYTADIPLIAKEFNLNVHCHADDGRLYFHERAELASSVVANISACIAEIERWMASNRRKLNPIKAQLIWMVHWYMVHDSSLPRWIPVQLFLAHPHWSANQPSLTLESSSTSSWHWRTMFVTLALPASTSFVSSVSCVDHSHPMHVHHLYMHSFQAGWFTATIWLQASQTPSFGNYSKCCMSLQDSEVRSYLRNHQWPASLAVCSTPYRLQVRSSGLHVLAHCTMRLLPIYLMEMVLYPCHTFPLGVCFVHLFTEILLCLWTDSVRLGHRDFSSAGPTLWNILPIDLKVAKKLSSLQHYYIDYYY